MHRTDIDDQVVMKKARRRIKAKKGFFAHLVTYISVISFLFMINMMTSPGFWWWLFPAGGWGIGLVTHYFSVFGILGIGGKEWERKELAREIERIEDGDDDILILDENMKLPNDKLELKEYQKMRKPWNDQDLV